MKVELSIIIVNYNGLKYLKDCFDSIYTYCNDVSFEIIVVDNNSSDESCAFLKKEYPKVILIESKKNLGFAGGNNIGVKKAVGKYLLLLNNDTILLNSISPALNLLQEDKIGVVGAKMLDKNKEYLVSVGNFPKALQLLKFSFLQNKNPEFVSGEFSKKQYVVDWVTGAFLIVSKKLYQKVNGLDEDYFMYVEDVDFCKKINDLGKKIIFLPQVSYIHFVGFNSSRESKLIKGYKIYANKHFNFVNTILAKLSLQLNYVYKKAFKNIR